HGHNAPDRTFVFLLPLDFRWDVVEESIGSPMDELQIWHEFSVLQQTIAHNALLTIHFQWQRSYAHLFDFPAFDSCTPVCLLKSEVRLPCLDPDALVASEPLHYPCLH